MVTNRTCTNILFLPMPNDHRPPVICGQPAQYAVSTINPDSGWMRLDWLCPGCAGRAIREADTAATLANPDRASEL